MQNLKLKNNNYPLILLLSLFLIFSAAKTLAAELFFDSEKNEFGINEQFEINLFLNTEKQEINAVEGKINFPLTLLDLEEIRNGNSIINFWVEEPKKDQNGITFSGIVPGGYSGEKGFILSLIFKTKDKGDGSIEITDARVLKNDGAGTEAELKISNFQFITSEELATTTGVQEIKDQDPPEDFIPEIGKDPEIFEGKWFLVFATQDKGSGIDHYEVEETKKNKIDNKNWTIAESPYELKDQNLESYIYVKAVDRSKNEKISSLSPQKPVIWYKKYWVLLIVLLVLIALLVVIMIIRRRKHKSFQ